MTIEWSADAVLNTRSGKHHASIAPTADRQRSVSFPSSPPKVLRITVRPMRALVVVFTCDIGGKAPFVAQRTAKPAVYIDNKGMQTTWVALGVDSPNDVTIEFTVVSSMGVVVFPPDIFTFLNGELDQPVHASDGRIKGRKVDTLDVDEIARRSGIGNGDARSLDGGVFGWTDTKQLRNIVTFYGRRLPIKASVRVTHLFKWPTVASEVALALDCFFAVLANTDRLLLETDPNGAPYPPGHQHSESVWTLWPHSLFLPFAHGDQTTATGVAHFKIDGKMNAMYTVSFYTLDGTKPPVPPMPWSFVTLRPPSDRLGVKMTHVNDSTRYTFTHSPVQKIDDVFQWLRVATGVAPQPLGRSVSMEPIRRIDSFEIIFGPQDNEPFSVGAPMEPPAAPYAVEVRDLPPKRRAVAPTAEPHTTMATEDRPWLTYVPQEPETVASMHRPREADPVMSEWLEHLAEYGRDVHRYAQQRARDPLSEFRALMSWDWPWRGARAYHLQDPLFVASAVDGALALSLFDRDVELPTEVLAQHWAEHLQRAYPAAYADSLQRHLSRSQRMRAEQEEAERLENEARRADEKRLARNAKNRAQRQERNALKRAAVRSSEA